MLCSAVKEHQDTHWVRKLCFDLVRWYLSGAGDKVDLGISASVLLLKKWHCFQESQRQGLQRPLNLWCSLSYSQMLILITLLD